MQHHRHHIATSLLVGLLLGAFVAGCGSKDKDKATGGSGAGSVAAGAGSAGSAAPAGSGAGGGSAGSAAPAVPEKDLDSKDILARTEVAPVAYVKHVLIGWKELASTYQGHMDPRAEKRSNAEAAQLAQEVLAKLKENPASIDALIKVTSEDPGSLNGDPYVVKATSQFVPEFKNLGLRLKEKESGIVRTKFGYHVMERIAPPPPDPLESADILKRTPPEPGPVWVRHVLIGWKDAPAARAGRADPRALARSKEDADKIAKDVLDKLRKNADMAKLMKQYSEDPGSKDSGEPYEVSAGTPMVEPFKDLSLRLKLNEVGLVKTDFGWHVMKRVPPPPPDPLESADILKREPVTDKAKVKHVLLSWSGANPRSEAAKKRDRPTLEKLIKTTVDRLNKGEKIDPIMAELSEDPGSASKGTSYDVSADAALVEPFKKLSLRLKLNEVGVVKTDFGYHIIQRVE